MQQKDPESLRMAVFRTYSFSTWGRPLYSYAHAQIKHTLIVAKCAKLM